MISKAPTPKATMVCVDPAVTSVQHVADKRIFPFLVVLKYSVAAF